MRTRPEGLTGRRCECGALVEQGRAACGKCGARTRWTRRKLRLDQYGDPG